MRHLILSDLHANIDALASVLRAVRQQSFDRVVVLGDLAGYGAAPNRVVTRVRGFGSELRIIRGNHDKVVAGIDDGMGFNPVALASVRWSREKLNEVNRDYLAGLPRGPLPIADFLICHGSPLDEDEYVIDELVASRVFQECEFSLCFFGHTHLPCVFALSGENLEWQPLMGDGGTVGLHPEARYFVNPGSVGQPRDGDPRASFMTYDSDARELQWYRVEYPVARAQRRILRAGLPELLAERLAYGR